MSSAAGPFFFYPPGLAGRSLMNISVSLREHNGSRWGGGLFLYISHIITCGESKTNLQRKGEKKNVKTFFLVVVSVFLLCVSLIFTFNFKSQSCS